MKKFTVLCLVALSLFGCKKESEENEKVISYLHGMYVSNEGNFMANNASITHISESGEVNNDVYWNANNAALGDVLQSFTVIGENGYAVLNNSLKVEVVGLNDMKNKATITGFEYPRYLVSGGNGKAYVSDGSMAGNVRVINTATNAIVNSIAVGNGPEKMQLAGNHLYVCNSGGWSLDNTVSVIDINTESVIQTITVGDRPQDIVRDASGDIWVLCSGETIYDADWNVIGHTDAKIYRINSTSLTVTDVQTIGSNGDHPRHIEISPDGTKIYLLNNGVRQFATTDTDYDGTSFITGFFGSMNVNPFNGELWLTSVSDFVGNSSVYQYNVNGSLKATYTAGIGANAVAFN